MYIYIYIHIHPNHQDLTEMPIQSDKTKLLLAKGNARASHNSLAWLTPLLVDDLPTLMGWLWGKQARNNH